MSLTKAAPWLRTFLVPLLPATVGGAAWDALGLPLGWLLGAAIVAGAFAMTGRPVAAPPPVQSAALATIGAGVGLSLTPEAAAALVTWAPVMALAAVIGIAFAVAASPVLARFGKVSPATAFFSLLPGGVIEMATVGEAYGANRTTIAALHALRVAMIVSVLPLALFALFPDRSADPVPVARIDLPALAAVLAVAGAGGWAAARVRLPAAWLLGGVIAVGAVTGFGLVAGALPPLLLIVAQIFVGIALGAKFRRETLRAMPRALAAAAPLLAAIMLAMALLGALASVFIPESVPTLVLCLSIGGMAEMVLTAKALGQNAAMVAAFQAIRAVLVNAVGGALWKRLARLPAFSEHEPREDNR